MPDLNPLPGFDWSRVAWRAHLADACSYCGAAIPEEEVPLILFGSGDRAAEFCRACQAKWWGMESFDG